MAEIRSPVVRITVELQVGDHLLAATDDPIFLGLRGSSGREFRLKLAKGRSLRRGHLDHFVFGAPEDSATNVEHPQMNDPTRPPLDAESITAFYLSKGFEPVPNVRALAEMDDRLEVAAVSITVETGDGRSFRFARQGSVWLGLVSGLRLEIPRADGPA